MPPGSINDVAPEAASRGQGHVSLSCKLPGSSQLRTHFQLTIGSAVLATRYGSSSFLGAYAYPPTSAFCLITQCAITSKAVRWVAFPTLNGRYIYRRASLSRVAPHPAKNEKPQNEKPQTLQASTSTLPMDMETQGGSPFHRSWLHKPWFQLWKAIHLSYLLSWVAGSTWYTLVELDPRQEEECLLSFQADAAQEKRIAVLGPVLNLAAGQPFPDTFEAALGALMQVFPMSTEERRKLRQDINHLRGADFRGSQEELDRECLLQEKKLLWKHLLKQEGLSPEAKALLFAWNRDERDRCYSQVQTLNFFRQFTFRFFGLLDFNWCPTLWFFKKSVAAIHKQEKIYREGVSTGHWGRLAFWTLLLLMIAGVIAPDTLNFFLLALLAVLRSLPNRPQAALMVFAIWDFPYADARLALFIGRTRFYGLLPTFIVGIAKRLDPEFAASFGYLRVLAWAAALSTVWQMLMHNGKNIYDMFFFLWIREQTLTPEQYAEMDRLVSKGRLCNMYSFAYLDHFTVSNRAGAQLSYYKQDQEDALACLKWSARIVEDGKILRFLLRVFKRERAMVRVSEHTIQSGDFFGKFCILVAIIAIGAIICASCFPSDPYAGLIAFAYYAPLSYRASGDVWDPSQSFEDVLRLFTTTAGPTLPSMIALIVNLVWWATHRRRGLFLGFTPWFWATLGGLFGFTLPTKLWGEWIKKAGEHLRCKFRKQRVLCVSQMLELGTLGDGSVFTVGLN
jgi:hypothetical protein